VRGSHAPAEGAPRPHQRRGQQRGECQNGRLGATEEVSESLSASVPDLGATRQGRVPCVVVSRSQAAPRDGLWGPQVGHFLASGRRPFLWCRFGAKEILVYNQ
jgi:hypothetical protein